MSPQVGRMKKEYTTLPVVGSDPVSTAFSQSSSLHAEEDGSKKMDLTSMDGYRVADSYYNNPNGEQIQLIQVQFKKRNKSVSIIKDHGGAMTKSAQPLRKMSIGLASGVASGNIRSDDIGRNDVMMSLGQFA